jgi:glycosyltransferase involved in cell wall biosynthesis
MAHGTILGSVIGSTPIGIPRPSSQPRQSQQPSNRPPEANLPRSMNYYADYSGCGFWRMIWPEHALNAYGKMVAIGSTVMCRDPSIYRGVKSVRFQRQASPHQLQFLQWMRKLADKENFRLIYEIDDVMFREDIPQYNKFRHAFEADEVRNASQEMIEMCDEVTVTCNYMKDYYSQKTSNQNVTVIPNYPPKWWLGHLFDESLIAKNYDRHVKKRRKPRILYAGSGAHFDVDNKANQQDDFAHVRNAIMKTMKDFQWVFVGAYPIPLQNLVKTGKIEFHPWAKLYDLPNLLKSLKINCMVAPLIDNTFNRCKSDIKFIEASALGVPIICQDMITYENALLKFQTGDDMIDQIKDVTSDKQSYLKHCRKANMSIQDRWLEDSNNLGKYLELYTQPYGDSNRELLNRLNRL